MKKLSLLSTQGVLSKNEMKSIMAGSGNNCNSSCSGDCSCSKGGTGSCGMTDGVGCTCGCIY